MIAVLRPVVALLVSAALLLMGNSLQTTLLPLRGSIENFSFLQQGILGSAYFLGFSVGCAYGNRIICHVGHIRAFAGMVSIASTIALLHALIPDPVIWWVLRAITGLCLAVLFMIIESWLNHSATNKNRGMIFSTYSFISLTVVSVGNAMIAFGDPGDFPLFLTASILVSLAAVPVALAHSKAPAPGSRHWISPWELYRFSPVGAINCLGVGMVNGAFWVFGPIFFAGTTTDLSAVALFMSVTILGGALGQWPLGWVSDHLDRRWVIAFAAFGATLSGAALLMIAITGARGSLIATGLYGFFAFPLYTLTIAHINDLVDRENMVAASGGALLTYGSGAVMGPILAAQIVGFAGIEVFFFYTALIHLLMACYVLFRLAYRRASGQDNTNFMDALRHAQTVTQWEKNDRRSSSSQDRRG